MANRKPDKVVQLISDTLDVAKIATVPIESGPVEVPLDRAAALWLLPWICEPECRFGARVLEAKAKKPKAIYASPGDTRDALWLLQEFKQVLAKVTSGTLEFLAVSSAEMNDTAAGGDDEDGEGEKEAPPPNAAARRAAARFRLSGPVADGMWTVSSSFPRVDAAQLRAALEILTIVDSDSNEWVRDAAEATAIAELAAKSSNFIRLNPAQVAQNTLTTSRAEITVTQNRRPYLALIIFRHRLGDRPWDVRTHKEWDEEFLAKLVESDRQMKELWAKHQEPYYVPRVRTLLESPLTVYYETDFGRVLFSRESVVTPLIVNRIDNIHYKAEIPFEKALPLIDDQFAALGMAHLGDFQSGLVTRTQAFRGYGSTSDGSMALFGIVAGNFVMHWMFFTILGKDFWVITATLPQPKASPKRSSYRDAGKMTLREMAAEHARHVTEHVSEGAPHASPKNLSELIQLMDAFNVACQP